jgi:tricorn protease-like protein
MKSRILNRFLLTGVILILTLTGISQGIEGYYRYPALHGNTIVFVAEGDIWKVSATGGAATRLTTHPGEESFPKISPDGKIIAFTASYEGNTQLDTAIKYLQDLIADDPRGVPEAPPFPDKSFGGNKGK